MLFCRDGGEGEFREGLGNANDGFELADGDRDAGALVGGGLEFMDALADLDEVRGELFGGFGGEFGGASAWGVLIWKHGDGKKGRYVLQ